MRGWIDWKVSIGQIGNEGFLILRKKSSTYKPLIWKSSVKQTKQKISVIHDRFLYIQNIALSIMVMYTMNEPCLIWQYTNITFCNCHQTEWLTSLMTYYVFINRFIFLCILQISNMSHLLAHRIFIIPVRAIMCLYLMRNTKELGTMNNVYWGQVNRCCQVVILLVIYDFHLSTIVLLACHSILSYPSLRDFCEQKYFG